MNRAMQSKLMVAAVLIVVLLIPVGAVADDLSDISTKLDFFYVANPNAANATAETINTAQVISGGGTGDFYTAANVSKFRDLIKAVLGSGVSGVNHTLLRSVLAQTLKITNKRIGVYLVNDNAATITNADNRERFGIVLEAGHAWPCAICYTEDRDTRTYGGSLSMGAWHLNNSSEFSTTTAILETFCHEVMHTQDLSDGRAHLFGAFSYGPDRTHYFVEAIPNMAMTYKEGIANFVGYWFNSNQESRVRQWFVNNDYIVVEKNPPTTLYNSLHAANIPEINPNTTTFRQEIKTNYAIYRIRSLPVDVIAKNEQVIAIILYEQAFYSTFDNVVGAIKQVNPNTFLVSTSAWAQLVEELCRRGLPSDIANFDEITSSDSNPKRFLLPLAICDYFTGFRSTTQAEFARIFENMLPDSLLSLYWDHRGMVRGAVNTSSLTNGDITNIAVALGITQSVQE